jgi:hypothetical protein
MILTPSSSMIPVGACSKADEAGKVNSESHGSGALGVVGEVMYVLAGLVGIDEAA